MALVEQFVINPALKAGKTSSNIVDKASLALSSKKDNINIQNVFTQHLSPPNFKTLFAKYYKQAVYKWHYIESCSIESLFWKKDTVELNR